VRVIQRPPHRVEVGEQQIAVDEAIDRVVTRRLLEGANRIARCGQQIAPPAPPQYVDGRMRAVTFWTRREIERYL
jgi:hypothetical protein